MASVRTVLGDVPADRLGRCDYHEHLFQASPLLTGDELDDEQRSGEEAATLEAAGIDAMVEATPTGLGRDPAAVARISARTGLAVVHVSGAHRREHYPAGHWLTELPEAELVRRFTADVTTGLPAADLPDRGAPALAPGGGVARADLPDRGAPAVAPNGGAVRADLPERGAPAVAPNGGAGRADQPERGAPAVAPNDGAGRRDLPERGVAATGPDGGVGRADRPERGGPALQPEPVRAGMLKAGVGYWRIDPFERRVLAAVGAAAAATGVPVMVHTEYGSAAWEVLDALAAAGVAADRVVLAHIDRNLDPGLHAELTAAGAYLGYDGMARHREAPDSAILDCLAKVAAAGDPDRLLLGGDVARRSRYRSYGGIPGLDYLPTRFLPRLRRELGDALVDRMLVANPARLLSLRT